MLGSGGSRSRRALGSSSRSYSSRASPGGLTPELIVEIALAPAGVVAAAAAGAVVPAAAEAVAAMTAGVAVHGCSTIPTARCGSAAGLAASGPQTMASPQAARLHRDICADTQAIVARTLMNAIRDQRESG